MSMTGYHGQCNAAAPGGTTSNKKLSFTFSPFRLLQVPGFQGLGILLGFHAVTPVGRFTRISLRTTLIKDLTRQSQLNRSLLKDL